MTTSHTQTAQGAGTDLAGRIARHLTTSRESGSEMAHSLGKLRIPELLLFFGLIFEGAFFGIPLPLNQLVMMAIIGLAMIRRPTYMLGAYQLLIPIIVLALFYVGLISMFSDPTEFAADWKRRIIRLALTAFLLFVVASGRIDFRSAIAGLGVGMVFNAVAFYAGIAPDNYGGVLSGFFMDKNVAGLAYAVYGVLIFYIAKRRSVRLLLVVIFGTLVVLTGSRTSMSAYAAALLWILLAPKLPVIGKWLLGAGIWAGVFIAAEDFSQVGQFSDREGSDLLRERIDAASEIKVQNAGFFGDGLGEAYVSFVNERETWFFHNSYWTAQVEGGWPWLIALVGITAVVVLRPFSGKLTDSETIMQAAGIAILICAWRLGEVFFTLTWVIVVAGAIQAALAARGEHHEMPERLDEVRLRGDIPKVPGARE